MKMRTLTNLFFVTVISVAAYSCANQKNKTATQAPDGHTAQNALDWQGSYSGVLPCADCEGIETELQLNSDQTYRLTSRYLKGNNQLADTLNGKFVWLENGNVVRLERKTKDIRPDLFKIEENQVKQLNVDGQEVTGALANFYILKKEGNPEVENLKWQLVELRGKPVKGTPQTHFIIFHSNDKRAEAKAGCNILSFSYKIKNRLQVKFGQGITTLMACHEPTEAELLKVLAIVDNLSVGEGILTLNRARMAPLAKFKLVQQ